MSILKTLFVCVLVVGISGLSSTESVASEDNAPFNVTSAGISTKGFFKVILEGLHAIYRDSYPGTSATFKPGTVAGGMVQAAKAEADIATAMPPVELQRGLKGIAPFPEPLEGKLMAVMTILDKLEFYFLANKAWADKNGIKVMADIAKAKPKANVALNRKGTFYINVAAEEIFKAYGFTVADLEKWGSNINYYATGPGIKDLKDGKVDFMVGAGFHPDRRIKDLANTRGIIWLDVGGDVLQATAKKLDMTVSTVPNSFYTFTTKDVSTLRATTLMGAGAHVPEATVYKVVRSVAENLDRIKAIHPVFKDFSIKTMYKKSDIIPWHPGAIKYYKEVGAGS